MHCIFIIVKGRIGAFIVWVIMVGFYGCLLLRSVFRFLPLKYLAFGFGSYRCMAQCWEGDWFQLHIVEDTN